MKVSLIYNVEIISTNHRIKIVAKPENTKIYFLSFDVTNYVFYLTTVQNYKKIYNAMQDL